MRQNSYKMTQNIPKWVLGHKVTPHETSGDYDLVMGETPPKVQGPPPHLHHSFKEVFLVVEGEMEFVSNGETKTVTAGESLDIPPKSIHTFRNKSDKVCKWVNIHSPKGFRDFFETLGVPANEPNAEEKSTAPELVQKVIQTAENYDMHLKF